MFDLPTTSCGGPWNTKAQRLREQNAELRDQIAHLKEMQDLESENKRLQAELDSYQKGTHLPQLPPGFRPHIGHGGW